MLKYVFVIYVKKEKIRTLFNLPIWFGWFPLFWINIRLRIDEDPQFLELIQIMTRSFDFMYFFLLFSLRHKNQAFNRKNELETFGYSYQIIISSWRFTEENAVVNKISNAACDIGGV